MYVSCAVRTMPYCTMDACLRGHNDNLTGSISGYYSLAVHEKILL